MTVAANILRIKEYLPEEVKLVAVSKTKPTNTIFEAYQSGHKIFGENKVQELLQKYEALPKDIEWHFIGHLQTNKVKYLVPFVAMIHGIDSFKLLKVVNREAARNNWITTCLLQFHIASESTKFGFLVPDAEEMLASDEFAKLGNVKIGGVMGMATYTDNMKQVRKEFRELVSIFNLLKNKYFKTDDSFREISMGMSDDYLIAAEEGSTIVRIGSKIFGKRNYI
ncbi:MAG: YggS family pyridoxal phosphate-dependent enzyme [Draconibacterium sp.]|nr:MAG: YggS family pyridoxal phosphate-dependent enzyme [Draconibacterium sp.]